MELKERVAYLRGLIEGREFGEANTEVLWERVLNLFDLVCMELDELAGEQRDLEEYVEAIDEDLGYLEEQCYPPEEGEDEAEETSGDNQDTTGLHSV